MEVKHSNKKSNCWLNQLRRKSNWIISIQKSQTPPFLQWKKHACPRFLLTDEKNIFPTTFFDARDFASLIRFFWVSKGRHPWCFVYDPPISTHFLWQLRMIQQAPTYFNVEGLNPWNLGHNSNRNQTQNPSKNGVNFFFQAVKSSQTTRPLQMYLEKIFWISGLTMEEHATSVQSTQTSFSNLNFTGKVQLVLKVMFSVWSEIWVGRKTYWFNFMSLLFKKGSLYRNKKGS